jgi:cytochrome c553
MLGRAQLNTIATTTRRRTMHRQRSRRWPLAAALLLSCAAPSAWAQSGAESALARSLAATCANCHGTNGNARGDMKQLAGVSAEKLQAQLADFRNGNQPATIMHQIVKGYTEDQLKLIAAYFAAQKPAAK